MLSKFTSLKIILTYLRTIPDYSVSRFQLLHKSRCRLTELSVKGGGMERQETDTARLALSSDDCSKPRLDWLHKGRPGNVTSGTGRLGNNKSKITALEDAYKELRSQLPNIPPTGKVTKFDILKAASQSMSFLTDQLREACNHGRMRDMVQPPPRPPNPDSEVRAPQTGYWSAGRSTGEKSQDRGGQEVWPLAIHDEVEVQIPDVWPQVNNDDRGVQATGWALDMSTLMPPVNSTTVPGQNHGQPLQCQGTPRPPSLQLNPHLWRQSHQSVSVSTSTSTSASASASTSATNMAVVGKPDVAHRNKGHSLPMSSDTSHHHAQIA